MLIAGVEVISIRDRKLMNVTFSIKMVRYVAVSVEQLLNKDSELQAPEIKQHECLLKTLRLLVSEIGN